MKKRSRKFLPSLLGCISVVCLPLAVANDGKVFNLLYSCSGGRHGNPLQYSCLENPIDRGAWQATVHGVAKIAYDLGSKPPNGKEIQGRGDICVCAADSLHCAAETNTTL